MISSLRWVALFPAICGFVLIAGCGGGSSAPAPTTEVSTAAAPSRTGSSVVTDVGSTPRGGRTMVGDIPLNVWFDDPLAEAARQGTTVSTPEVAAVTSPKPNMEEKVEEPESASSGGDDWSSLISMTIIQDETKKIRLGMNNSLQAVSQYNAHYKEIQVDGAVLAALAGIAIAHPEPVSWKDNAKFIRDLSAEVADKAKGLGAKPFEETQLEFEKVNALLNNNTPAELPEAASEMPFSEVAKRGGIMKRMDKAFQWLKSTITTEEILKEEAEGIIHEATILAALAKVVGTEGYASADEQEYLDYVKTMIDANLAVIAAAKAGDFQAFTDANSRSQKACDECHVGYRFADDF